MPEYRNYSVSRRDKEPMLRFVLDALEAGGCRVIHHTEPDVAPFRITFETPDEERLGIVVYAFFANSRITKNRPEDEHRFQVKYGPDDKKQHRLWQDPFPGKTARLALAAPGLSTGRDAARPMRCRRWRVDDEKWTARAAGRRCGRSGGGRKRRCCTQ